MWLMEASRPVAIAVLLSLGELVVLLHLPTLLFLEPPAHFALVHISLYTTLYPLWRKL